MRTQEKEEEDTESWGGVDILERLVRGGLTEKVTRVQRPGGRERTNCGHIKGRTF